MYTVCGYGLFRLDAYLKKDELHGQLYDHQTTQRLVGLCRTCIAGLPAARARASTPGRPCSWFKREARKHVIEHCLLSISKKVC